MKIKDSSASMSRYIVPLGLGVVLIVASLLFIIGKTDSSTWDFRNNLWGPAHLLLKGLSPYRIDQLFTGSNSVWLPQAIGVFAPLGAFTQAQATNIWMLLSLISLLVVMGKSIQRNPVPLPLLAIALLMTYIFPPVVSHVVLGQYGILAMLLVIIAVHLQQRGAIFWAGMAVALALAKPQLVILPVLGMIQVGWQLKGWRGAVSLVLFMALGGLLMTLPLWIAYPDWISGFLYALKINPVWLHPSSYTALRIVVGDLAGVAWVILVMLLVLTNIVLWRTKPPQQAIAYSLALNTFLAPYIWSWDFVMWLPILVLMVSTARHWLARGVILMGYTAVVVGAFWVRINTTGDDVLFWWMPWVLGVTVVIAELLNRRVAVVDNGFSENLHTQTANIE